MNVTRRVRVVVAGAAVAAAAVLGWQAVAAADAGDAGPGHGMRRMHDLMESGNPGMAQMHEQMQNDRARQAHESMMQDADMASMHESMMGAESSPGS